MHTDPGQKLVFHQNTMPISHVKVNRSSGNPLHIINDQNVSCANATHSPVITNSPILPMHENPPSAVESPSLISSLQLPSPPNLDVRIFFNYY